MANGENRTLEPKSFRLLQFLVENRHRVVPKEEILSVVWEGVAVSDNALTRAIAQIRKALDDDPKQPRYIETVPTVGYRFAAELSATVVETKPPVPAPVRTNWRRAAFWAAGAGFVLIAVAGVAAWSLRPKVAVPAPAPVTIPLTTYRGSEEAPSFSPDGNQVAFSWDGEKQDNYDIYVKALGSEAPLRLTSDPALETDPVWSPDGRTIAFKRRTGLHLFDVILIPALGGAERKLGEFQAGEDGNGYTLAWSVDSKWLVAPSAFPGENRSRLMKVSVESGEVSQITEGGPAMDSWPRISPDGRKLLFTRKFPRAPGDLYEARIDGNVSIVGTPHQIPLGGLQVGRAVWTEDGREILANTPGGAYRFPEAGTGAPQRVAWLPVGSSWPTISPKGNRLAYGAVRGDANIWRIDLEAKRTPRPERLIASTFRDVYPKYSPDGKRIAFYSNRGGNAQVWMGNGEGGQARQITFMKPPAAGTPSWRPDGKMLVLDSNTTGLYQVYTMSPEGGKLTQLTPGPSTNFGGSWSRDMRWIYFASNRTGRNEVWKMPADGGAAVRVTRNGGVKAFESEDGKTIYFNKESGAGSIWKMPAAGGAEEMLAESLYRFNFAVAKKGIYYMAAEGEDGNTELKFYSFANGNTSTVAPMGYPEFGLDVSPDGRYLIYAQLDDWASDLMLVENFR